MIISSQEHGLRASSSDGNLASTWPIPGDNGDDQKLGMSIDVLSIDVLEVLDVYTV